MAVARIRMLSSMTPAVKLTAAHLYKHAFEAVVVLGLGSAWTGGANFVERIAGLKSSRPPRRRIPILSVGRLADRMAPPKTPVSDQHHGPCEGSGTAAATGATAIDIEPFRA